MKENISNGILGMCARVLMLVLAAMQFAAGMGQSKKTHKEDIFKDLAQGGVGRGTVSIHQNPKMALLVNRKIKENENKLYITYNGYRIQAYMDNNQKKSKEEAYEREKKLKEKYPDLTTYISFSSPFWKLRVGDFRTHADALVMLRRIREDFPELAMELLVVKDEETRDVDLEPVTEEAKKEAAKKK